MARKAGLVAVLAGTADIIPLGRIVSRVGQVPAMRMTGKLLNVLNEVAEQGLKSGGQQTANNLIAQHFYDANRVAASVSCRLAAFADHRLHLCLNC